MNLRDGFQKMFRPYAERSFAAMRIDFLLGRIYPLVMLAIAVLTSGHAFEQLAKLDAFWFWLTWGLMIFAFIGLFVQHWFFHGGRIFYLVHAFSVLLTLATWSLQYPSSENLGDRPWVYSTLGMAALSAGIGLARFLAWPIMIAIPIWWVFIRISPAGGGDTLLGASQDAIYTFLFSTTFVALIQMLRARAEQADTASVAASEAIAEQARVDAVERERIRIDATVHELLLTTLVKAASAERAADQKEAKQAALEALEQLRNFEQPSSDDQNPVAVTVLFSSIQKIVETHFPTTKISTNGDCSLVVGSDVASAFTEATTEALKNSFQFAGPQAKQQVLFKCNDRSFKIVIKDEGRGFRPSRVAKNRLGIRLVIRGQVEAVGGEVKIDSRPGEGCNVVLEWAAN